MTSLSTKLQGEKDLATAKVPGTRCLNLLLSLRQEVSILLALTIWEGRFTFFTVQNHKNAG
jgi:hypothetical protein